MNVLILLRSLIYSLCSLSWRVGKPKPQSGYVVGSNYGLEADPNALAMVEYLVKLDYRVFYVSDSQPHALAGLTGFSHLPRNSFQAAAICFSARACFYTHSFSDVIPYGHKLSWLFKLAWMPKLVFLQHGVIGLKSTLANGVSMQDYLGSLEATFDKMVVSSEVEFELVESLGVPTSKIALAGLPRYDRYQNVVHKRLDSAVVFFTWQEPQQFYKKLELIRKSKIKRELAAHGYSLKLCLHNMQQDAGQIEKVFGETSISIDDMLHCCQLLITDESSIAWDMFYLRREVIFINQETNWLMHDDFLTKRVVNTEKMLEQRVRGSLKSDFRVSGAGNFFSFRDNHNCQRVLGALEGVD